MSTGGSFPYPYKECFVLLPNRCGISQSTHLRAPASSLVLVSLSNRCGISQSTPFGAQRSASTCSLLQSRWDLPIHPLWSPASLLAHRLVSSPLRGLASSLAHHPVSGSDIICNSASANPSLPLVDIVHFGLSLLGFSSRFLKRIC